MILQQLWKDADDIFNQVFSRSLPPEMYDYKPLRFIIELDTDPRISATLKPMEVDGDKNKRGIRRDIPYVGRTSDVSPILLADTSDYILGIAAESETINTKKPKKFRELIEAAWEDTKVPGLSVVLRFLDNWHSGTHDFNVPSDMKNNDLFGFRVNGAPDWSSDLLSDDPRLQQFWAKYTLEAKPRKMRCLVSDAEADIETKLPLMIKGLFGSQGAGAAFSSFNCDAFKSYGLASHSAAISRDAGEKFAKALNALLVSKEHHVRGGNITYVFWARGVAVPLFAFQPQYNDPKTLREFINAAWKGDTQWANGLPPDEKFHIFGLTANNGRVVVRSVLDMTIEELGKRQAEWFTRLEVCDAYGEEGKPLALWQLFSAPYRVAKDVPASVEDALVQAAFAGRRLPLSLLQTLVMRCRIGTVVNKKRVLVSYERAALLKYILTQHLPLEEAKTMSNEVTDVLPDGFSLREADAYHLGRLFCELESIQSAALNNPNTTIADKFYGSASTAPAGTFGLLLAGTKNHLSKMRRAGEKTARDAHFAQKRLDLIISWISDYPKTLTLREQSLFGLGYYQYRAARRHDVSEKSVAKQRAALFGTVSSDVMTSETTDDEGETE